LKFHDGIHGILGVGGDRGGDVMEETTEIDQTAFLRMWALVISSLLLLWPQHDFHGGRACFFVPTNAWQ